MMCTGNDAMGADVQRRRNHPKEKKGKQGVLYHCSMDKHKIVGMAAVGDEADSHPYAQHNSPNDALMIGTRHEVYARVHSARVCELNEVRCLC